MSKFSRTSLMALSALYSALALPAAVSAQSVSMMGNDARAGLCFEYAKAEKASSSAVKTCTHSLAHENLTRRDRAAVFVNRGILQRLRGDIEQAYNDYQSALELISDMPEAIGNRGNIFYLAGQFERAIADYQSSIDLGISDEKIVRLNTAMAYAEMKAHARAVASYDDLMNRYPDWADARARYDRYLARVNAIPEL